MRQVLSTCSLTSIVLRALLTEFCTLAPNVMLRDVMARSFRNRSPLVLYAMTTLGFETTPVISLVANDIGERHHLKMESTSHLRYLLPRLLRGRTVGVDQRLRGTTMEDTVGIEFGNDGGRIGQSGDGGRRYRVFSREVAVTRGRIAIADKGAD